MKRIYTQPLDAKVDALETKASDLEKAVQKCPYRIGDVLMTFNETHPGTSWPGTTWERLDDRFLIGAGNTYALDATGGSTTKNLQHVHSTGNHTLTIDEMPAHKHQLSYRTSVISNGTSGTWYFDVGTAGTTVTSNSIMNTGGGKAHNHGNTGNGGSTAQDIMPPYRAVYMYRRLT